MSYKTIPYDSASTRRKYISTIGAKNTLTHTHQHTKRYCTQYNPKIGLPSENPPPPTPPPHRLPPSTPSAHDTHLEALLLRHELPARRRQLVNPEICPSHHRASPPPPHRPPAGSAPLLARSAAEARHQHNAAQICVTRQHTLRGGDGGKARGKRGKGGGRAVQSPLWARIYSIPPTPLATRGTRAVARGEAGCRGGSRRGFVPKRRRRGRTVTFLIACLDCYTILS